MGLDISFYKVNKDTELWEDNNDRVEVEDFRKVNFLMSFTDNYVEPLVSENDFEVEYSKEDVEKLVELCKKTIEEKTGEYLPTQNGLFFGPTAIDEFYFKEVERVLIVMEKVLNELDFNEHSLWISAWY